VRKKSFNHEKHKKGEGTTELSGLQNHRNGDREEEERGNNGMNKIQRVILKPPPRHPELDSGSRMCHVKML